MEALGERYTQIIEDLKGVYEKVAPIAYNGYIELQEGDEEIVEALRILREAGVFDNAKYIRNTRMVESEDEEFRKLAAGDYEYIAKGDLEETESDEDPDYVLYSDDTLQENLADKITYADIEFAGDVLALSLPTPEQLFDGFTANPKYKEVFGQSPQISYGKHGLDGQGNTTGEKLEDYIQRVISESENQANEYVAAEADEEWVDDVVAGETASREQLQLLDLLMADGDKPDILSEVVLPISEQLKEQHDGSGKMDDYITDKLFNLITDNLNGNSDNIYTLAQKIAENGGALTPDDFLKDGVSSTDNLADYFTEKLKIGREKQKG